MDFFELIKERHSIRAYSAAPISADRLNQILEAANQAPSAGNLQAYEIFLVTRPHHKQALATAALGQEFLAQAPVVLVFFANPLRSQWRYRERGTKLYSLQDATIACAFAMLAATALGISTVWVGAFVDSEVCRAVNAPEGLVPVAMLPLGYAAEEPGLKPRRDLGDLVHEVGS